MSKLDILKRAREILSDPLAWCKDTFARDKEGMKVWSGSVRACQFCAIGAIARAAKDLDASTSDHHAAELTLEEQVPLHYRQTVSIGKGSVASYNDDPRRTHSEILALFDRTIEDVS